MTFREFMRENGYELQTTFWEDFSIADRFGLSAIQDTFKRAFEEWKNNYKYLTELILVLNHKIWQYYETKPEFATLYNTTVYTFFIFPLLPHLRMSLQA